MRVTYPPELFHSRRARLPKCSVPLSADSRSVPLSACASSLNRAFPLCPLQAFSTIGNDAGTDRVIEKQRAGSIIPTVDMQSQTRACMKRNLPARPPGWPSRRRTYPPASSKRDGRHSARGARRTGRREATGKERGRQSDQGRQARRFNTLRRL